MNEYEPNGAVERRMAQFTIFGGRAGSSVASPHPKRRHGTQKTDFVKSFTNRLRAKKSDVNFQKLK